MKSFFSNRTRKQATIASSRLFPPYITKMYIRIKSYSNLIIRLIMIFTQRRIIKWNVWTFLTSMLNENSFFILFFFLFFCQERFCVYIYGESFFIFLIFAHAVGTWKFRVPRSSVITKRGEKQFRNGPKEGCQALIIFARTIIASVLYRDRDSKIFNSHDKQRCKEEFQYFYLFRDKRCRQSDDESRPESSL